ncbi:glycoside hydrolase family 10 protein [Myriangium duriaei CBS 260.36]|uniref:Beta-xylanase n=1 Tax=Myriangium duriaei CBS 260.36 TaxID=1168546 RepID=A0A9P4MHQ2_9PEZI|nr:glycoside hydrolase family 10 protein [Myriangium duriaei CBS 260.36]
MKQFNNTRDFGQAVPANVMKWQYAEPQQGKFDFSLGDQFIKIAKANKQLVRCHNLVWYEQTPNWISTTKWTKASLLAAVENRVKTTIAHYGDSCYCWDVVNEALNDDGTYRTSIFYNVTGTEYIATAFRAAQETVAKHNLKVKLYYNDYNIEYPGAKATAAQNNIVKFLKKKNIKIDGVGLQSHFIVGETPSTASQMQNMASFSSLGVEVAVTELDIRTTVPVTQAAQQQQVADFNSTAAACALTKSCVGVTLWDFDDTYSWIPSVFTGQGWGTPWYQPNGTNTPLVKKIAYGGLVSGLQAGAKGH